MKRIKWLFNPPIRFLYSFYYIYKFLRTRQKVLKTHNEKDVLSKDGIEFVTSYWGVLNTALHLKDLLPNEAQATDETLSKLSYSLIMRYLGVVSKDLETVGLTKLLVAPECNRYENSMVYVIKFKPKFHKEAYNSLIYLIKTSIYTGVIFLIYKLIQFYFI